MEALMPGERVNWIRDDVLTAHLEGEAVLLDLNTKRYYRLNATAARLWKGLTDGLPEHEIVATLVEEFEVERTTAQAETDCALDTFRTHGLIT